MITNTAATKPAAPFEIMATAEIFELFVLTLTGKNITLNAQASDLVLDLKKQIALKEGIEDRFNNMYHGQYDQLLNDDKNAGLASELERLRAGNKFLAMLDKYEAAHGLTN